MKDKDQNKPIKGPQRTQKQMQGRGNLEITVTNILQEGGEDIVSIKHKMLQERINQSEKNCGWRPARRTNRQVQKMNLRTFPRVASKVQETENKGRRKAQQV